MLRPGVARSTWPARATPLVLCGALLTTACTSEPPDPSPQTAEELWRIDPEPVVVVGDVDTEPEYLFDMVRSAHLLGDGRLAVADWATTSVRLYDFEGRFLRAIGGPGKGPGEFRHLGGTAIAPPDTLHVLDMGSRRLNAFLLDGTSLGATALVSEGWGESLVGRFTDGSIVVAFIGSETTHDGTNSVLWSEYEHYTATGEYLGRIARQPARWSYTPPSFEPPPVPVPVGLRHPFSPDSHVLVRGDTMFMTNGVAPELHVLSREGGLVRTIRLPPSRIPFSAALDRFRRALEEQGNQRWLARLDDVPRVDSVPQIATVLMDDEGLIWAKAYDPGSDPHPLSLRGLFQEFHGGRWWVVDREGQVHSTVTVPERFIPMDVRGSYMIGITVDELDVERVVVYRILGRP